MKEAPQFSDNVSRQLRKARKQQKLTLQDMSEKTGISVSMLSKIETGRTTMNFKNVIKIAGGLGIPVASIIGTPLDSSPLGRRAMTVKGAGIVQDTEQLRYEVLCDDLVQKKNVQWKVTVKARHLEDYTDLSRHPGEEFLLVLSGSIDLHTDLYKPVRLNEGDSVCFDATMGHAYVSTSKKPALLLMTNSML